MPPTSFQQNPSSLINERVHSNIPFYATNDDRCHRTIDDFLDELHIAYNMRFIQHNDSGLQSNITPQHRRSIFECISEPVLKITRQIHRFLFINKCRCNDGSCHRYLPLPLLALCIANSSDATEILMLSYLLANPSFRQDIITNQDGDNSNMEGAEYLASSIFFGMLLGGTVLGFLSDSIGRKPALLIGLLTNAIAGTLSSIPFITPTFVELTVLRFIAGIGIGATVPPLFSLASEWAPKDIRGSVVTTVASFWMVGSLFVSGVAWCLFRDSDGTHNATRWRLFAALCALPSALGAFMVYRYVPESARFLTANHDYSQAARSCNQMAFALEVSTPSATYTEDENRVEMSDFRLLNPKELESTSTDNHGNADRSQGLSCTKQSKFVLSIKSIVDTLANLYSRQLVTQTTLPLQCLWFALSFGTYGITTWINSIFVAVHLQNLFFNSFLFALANLPGNILSILYSDKWGRKRMLVGSLLGAASSLAGFAMLVYFGGDTEEGNTWLRTDAIVLFACAFQMFSVVSWNSIDIISGELFPTRVRSAGMGVCTASGRMGAMLAQIVNARLIMGSSNDSTGDGEASSSVLIVASSALLFGAFMPLLLGQDATGGELKDEVGEVSFAKKTISCGGLWSANKEHLSDEEADANTVSTRAKKDALQVLEYDSFRHEVEANQPFLL